MKILISTVLMVFFTTIVLGQTLERTKKGYRYEDKDISTKTLKQLYHQNPEALKAYKKGNLKRNSSAGFYLAGVPIWAVVSATLLQPVNLTGKELVQVQDLFSLDFGFLKI